MHKLPLSQPPNLGFLDIIGFAQAAPAERQKGLGGGRRGGEGGGGVGGKGLGRREKRLLTGRYTHAGQALAHAG